ncbi:ExbD/TolR family protein [Eionea flava]
MQFRRQTSQDEQINLTPLIDVVFLLLIFFMVSTTFTKETHLEINLPEASSDPAVATESDVVDITINTNGDYVINGKALVNQQADTLRRALQELSQGDNSLPLTVTADATTPHQSVVRAMDVAGQLGFAKLRITTRQPTPAN